MRTGPERVRVGSVVIALAVISLCLCANSSTPADGAQREEHPNQRSIGAAPAELTRQLPVAAKRWAIIIGIDRYEDSNIKQLEGAINDAKALEQALVKYAGFPSDQITRLTSDQPKELQPTRLNIRREMYRLRTLVDKDGLLLFAFSGHGISSADGQAFLLPSDTSMFGDVEYLKDEALPVEWIKEKINATGVRQRIMLLDACRDNPAGRGGGTAKTEMTEAYARGFNFDRRNDHVNAFLTLYATSPGQKAYENPNSSMGYFTEAIIEGLKGEAANKATGEVTLGALIRYVTTTVPKRTRAREGDAQQPWAGQDGYAEELVIAKVTPTESLAPAPPARTKGELVVLTSPPMAARVSIRGRDGSAVLEGMADEEGKYRAELIPGTYDVSVSVDNHQTVTRKSPPIKPGEQEILRVDLAATTGSLILLGSFQADTTILIDGKPAAGAIKSADQVEIRDLMTGRHTVSIRHPRMEPWEREVEIKSGAPTPVISTLERRLAQLTVRGEPGALVYIDGAPKALVANNGQVKITGIEPGQRNIKVEKEGYERFEQLKTLVAGEAEISVKLTRKMGSEVSVPGRAARVPFVIATTPQDASVVVEDPRQNYRQEGTSVRGEFSLELDPGTYVVTVNADKHVTFNKTITITPGQSTAFLPVSLSPTTGTLLLLGSFNPGTDVLIDGSVVARLSKPESRVELNDIDAGFHVVKVTHPAHEAWEERLEIKPGAPSASPVTLRRKMADLVVKTERGALIYLDGNPKARANDSGEGRISGVEPGVHTIKAEKEGYESAPLTREFTAGTAEITLKLSPMSYSPPMQDSFGEGLQSWIAPASWQANRTRGNLSMIVNGPGVGLFKDLVNDVPHLYKDFKLEFDISFRNGKGAVWIVRHRDQQNYYMFQLTGPKGSSPNTFRSYICRDGEIRQLKPAERVPEDLSRPNDSFTITVEARGSEITHKIRASSAPKAEEPKPFSVLQNTIFPHGGLGFATKEGEEFIVRFVVVVPYKSN